MLKMIHLVSMNYLANILNFLKKVVGVTHQSLVVEVSRILKICFEC